METAQQVLAAHFDECSRLLRAHPERFDEQALEQIGVAAGLSIRVVRLTARGLTLAQVMRDVGGPLVVALYRSTRGDRMALSLLAGARRGFVHGADRATARPTRSTTQYVVESHDEGPSIISSCPRCGYRETRDVAAPAPCQICAFIFEPVG